MSVQRRRPWGRPGSCSCRSNGKSLSFSAWGPGPSSGQDPPKTLLQRPVASGTPTRAGLHSLPGLPPPPAASGLPTLTGLPLLAGTPATGGGSQLHLAGPPVHVVTRTLTLPSPGSQS